MSNERNRSNWSDWIEEGKKAPNFCLATHNRETLKLSSLRGAPVVLSFYPKDDTPGCTEQACKFRDDLHQLTELGAQVIGISVDNTSSHAAFAKKYNLQFPLLSDSKAETAARYGSLLNLGIIKFAKRNTFLIDPQGIIVKVYLSANASRNALEVVEDLKKLTAL